MAQASYPLGSCPTCRKPAVAQFRPFCSARCKDVDLHRWFSGAYAIPAEEPADGAEDEAPIVPREKNE